MLDNLLEIEKNHLNELRSNVDEEKYTQFKNDFLARCAYESTTIDGKNQMTLSDVAHLIEKQVITSAFSEREQKEVLNYVKAFLHVEKLVNQRKWIDEEILKDLHEILVDGIFVGGRYRQVNVQIKNSMHQPPDYIKVYDRMNKYFFDINSHRGDPIQKAALAHAGLSKIYPFLEGNGRLARLVMNYVLMYYGYIAISIPIEQKDEYYQYIDNFKVEKSLDPLTNFIKQKLLDQYEYCINRLEE